MLLLVVIPVRTLCQTYPLMSYFRLVCRVFFAALLSTLCVPKCFSQDAIEAPTFSPEQEQVIADLAHHLLSDSAKANCPVTQCRILVTNFFLPSENTCTACMALAKAFTRVMTVLEAVFSPGNS
jgi:hypothetical protein